MNRERRDLIESVRERVLELIAELEAIKEAEEDALENVPEGLRETEKASNMETAIECLDDAIEALREVDDTHLDGAMA
jgi:sugar phosphate isomerase/epimerase